MKKIFFFLPAVLLTPMDIYTQNNISVEIIAYCENLPENSSVYITGNDPAIGNWQPDFALMNELNPGKWTKILSFPIGKALEFKITRGSWDNEALNDDGTVPLNHKLNVTNDTTIVIKVKLWADQFERKIEGQITGIVKYHLNLKYDGLKPRDVIVWLPPFYFLEQEKRYPVLYMHDGQNIVNPKTSAFKIDWQIDETADSLIRKGLIEPVIIVGIYNTSDRRSEYSENDTGYTYMKFSVDFLKPFIDKNYRTRTEREFTATGGSSMGGLISFMLQWEYPEIFSKAICLSPAFSIGRFNFVDNVETYEGEKKKIQFYIDNGGDELDSQLQPGVEDMLSALRKKGYKEKEDFYWFKDEKAPHNESAWAKRIWRALIYLFGTGKGRKLL